MLGADRTAISAHSTEAERETGADRGRKADTIANLTDEELLFRIGRGESAALTELYDRYRRVVYRHALRKVGQRETAEDLTLEVFTEVWRCASRYSKSRAAARTWLLAICRHRVIDSLRRFAVRPCSLPAGRDEPFDATSGINEDTPERRLLEQEGRFWVRQAILSLPTEQAEILTLAYFEGFTQREIAEILRKPLGTVKTRTRLGLKKLGRLLKAQ